MREPLSSSSKHVGTATPDSSIIVQIVAETIPTGNCPLSFESWWQATVVSECLSTAYRHVVGHVTTF